MGILAGIFCWEDKFIAACARALKFKALSKTLSPYLLSLLRCEFLCFTLHDSFLSPDLLLFDVLEFASMVEIK